jgi:hypothetical protein
MITRSGSNMGHLGLKTRSQELKMEIDQKDCFDDF